MIKAFSENNFPPSIDRGWKNISSERTGTLESVMIPETVLLEVKRINYASPGQIVFGGVEKVLEHLLNIIKYYLPNKRDKLNNDKLKQEIEILKQQKYKLFIENIKELGHKPESIDYLFLQEEVQGKLIQDFILQGKITGTELKNEN